MEIPASSQVSLVGGEMSVRKRVLALACAPPGRPGEGTHARGVNTENRSRGADSDASVGVNSYARPSAAGVQLLMIMPLTTYMTPKRDTGLAAVRACAVSAGIMPSSSGNANDAPRP